MITPEFKSKLRTSKRIKILVVLLTIFLIVLMFPKGESLESEITVGSIWIHDDLIASTTFEILKDPKIYEAEKNLALKKVMPIFERDIASQKQMLDSMANYSSLLVKLFNKTNSISENSVLSKDALVKLQDLKTPQTNVFGKRVTLNELLHSCQSTLNEIFNVGLLSASGASINSDTIALRNGKYEHVYPKDIFVEQDKLNEYISFKAKSLVGSNSNLVEVIEEYIHHFAKPNIVFNQKLTEEAVKSAKDKVTRNIGIVNENERIVAKHDRISEETKLKIDSYRIAKGEERNFWSRFLQNIGKFLHIFLVMLPLMIYIHLFRPKIFGDNLTIGLISIVALFISFLTYLVYNINVSSPIEYLILVPVASMLLTIIFDSRIGFYTTVVISIIVGALRGNDYVFAVTNIVAGGLAAYTVRDIKNRTQIYRSFLYILLGYFLSILAFGLERFDSVYEMLAGFSFAAFNALISPVLTYGLIIFVEKLFNLTTDLTFLELTDLNRPLLKELAKNAPGTFSHSVSMGTLAETTAEAVGANAVLAKVGAYYHDIGKTFDPESFVENQIDSHNIHENLAPERSKELIREHVQKGIELAEKNGLPKEIIDFIPMHHGTMVISYFYEKAKALYGDDNVDVEEFRYPGPKPNTKETAIVMLADACESTVRSLSGADPQIIENVINNLINSRIEDGQLDNAPLTFSDIKKIKESFLSILMGHHHRRIRYPNQEELESKPEE
ncbi:MAG: HDIG domain-containing protein [Stygiobacter sp.]|nr:MAG: hydrolase [Stygiobacter sp. GWC2_38_9]OGV08163.1 MAG: hydrolase [Stygiobacter sp. RIFOXYB2_FULL_37_11]OGV11272.1 MAG: hydrolase [Stygiobacter sp. RIFOXYA2_FULL_38_8]OGV15679.1 MAG: hydrolase [Stygiobacter sp. RIFOXYC2_FULL_38_25]OGV80793.1 MAG: hydrolase [Stygiobacter sp. GWF2_38_21]RJQ64609.1 MAG: HDIG domain-containing protein [Stygiobacter sp.]